MLPRALGTGGLKPRCRTAAAGFTIIDSLVGAVVILIALGGVFQVSSRCMAIISGSHNVGVASAMVQERIQQIQGIPWEMLTDSDSYTDQVWVDPEDGTSENYNALLKNATVSGAQLVPWGVREYITISAYRPVATTAAVPTPIKMTLNSPAVTVTSSPSTLVDEQMVRVDLRITWTDNRLNVPRSMGTSALIAKKSPRP